MSTKNTSQFFIGQSDFRFLRESQSYYVDKSDLISGVIEKNTQTFLFPRPRRFGKTSNLSMLRYFFEKSAKSQKSLFKGLAVEKNKEVMKHQGQYPVIFLTFKDMKDTKWESIFEKIKIALSDVYEQHEQALKDLDMKKPDRDIIQQVLNQHVTQSLLENTLQQLSKLLHQAYGKPPVILIDEYDVPIQAGYQYGYYEEIVAFMRNFLSAGFKDNSHLYKGVITGILRVAKESIFSGLNNLGVYSLVQPEFSNAFGFTEEEVDTIFKDFHAEEHLALAQQWYNGYRFGNKVVYNPWSIISFIASESRLPQPYWINTGSYQIIQELVTQTSPQIDQKLELLLKRESIQSRLDESIVYQEIQASEVNVWSFLVFSGYLKASNPKLVVEGFEHVVYYQLEIPNLEVLSFFHNVVRRWLEKQMPPVPLNSMLQCLRNHQMDEFGLYLNDIVKSSMSFHDVAGEEPERVYHAFVMGALLNLGNDYVIDSNREAGYGRYDILLSPKDKKQRGYIFEFKKINTHSESSSDDALQSALKQIQERDYADALRKQGVSQITGVAVVVDKKQTWTQWIEM